MSSEEEKVPEISVSRKCILIARAPSLSFLSDHSFELWLDFKSLIFPWGTGDASGRLRASQLEAS